MIHTLRIILGVARFLPALLLNLWLTGLAMGQPPKAEVVDAKTFRGKVMCGYQGWFRCPGDAAGLGWRHWSRDGNRITPRSLTFEMWPDMTEYGADEKFAAPGFSYPDGKPAELFSSDQAATVLRHFSWMRDYGIDGAWLQHFAVDLPGGPAAENYPSRRRVLDHVRKAAAQTGRAWALTYDISGMPTDRIYEVVTADWKRLVDEGITKDERYLHEGGKPVVELFGFYYKNSHNRMTAELANRLIDFFKAPGPYQTFFVGGGDWDWRTNPDKDWQAFFKRFDAYSPWNVGNYGRDSKGVHHASTGHWARDRRECEKQGPIWYPVVYPGFSWDNLQRKPAGSTALGRNGGRFFWEQFHELSKLGVDTVYVAMFDEVDEGTAIFKVTNAPPTQAHFLGYEGLPSDWYLRLTGEAAKMLRKQRLASAEIPIKP
ncbi:glycoside hydrolase family 71/99-like protein [Singulisphaera sp. PoT]|uniref:glycoside hydrolase family 71/99-like protein n=1 Tax=Singulisphaera sp. PoT TaxID=3411797 RepID=UPI003BF47A21